MVQYLKDLKDNPEFTDKLKSNLSKYGLPATGIAAMLLGANAYYNKKKRLGESKDSRRKRIRRNLLLTGAGSTLGIGGLLLGKSLLDSNLSLSSRLLNQPYKGGLLFRDAIQSGDSEAITTFKQIVKDSDKPSMFERGSDSVLGFLGRNLPSIVGTGAGVGLSKKYLARDLLKNEDLVKNYDAVKKLENVIAKGQPSTGPLSKLTKWIKGTNIDDNLYKLKDPDVIKAIFPTVDTTSLDPKVKGQMSNVIESIDDILNRTSTAADPKAGIVADILTDGQHKIKTKLNQALTNINNRPIKLMNIGKALGSGGLGFGLGKAIENMFNAE